MIGYHIWLDCMEDLSLYSHNTSLLSPIPLGLVIVLSIGGVSSTGYMANLIMNHTILECTLSPKYNGILLETLQKLYFLRALRS